MVTLLKMKAMHENNPESFYKPSALFCVRRRGEFTGDITILWGRGIKYSATRRWLINSIQQAPCM